ncbi:hypothetical protein K474DRAFT_651796 [Panus rudis PR-1116 ss-1]|nr:hypothetical protein K474DRAFT_651796 [Panus rudis PR-1116 ss-1]
MLELVIFSSSTLPAAMKCAIICLRDRDNITSMQQPDGAAKSHEFSSTNTALRFPHLSNIWIETTTFDPSRWLWKGREHLGSDLLHLLEHRKAVGSQLDTLTFSVPNEKVWADCKAAVPIEKLKAAVNHLVVDINEGAREYWHSSQKCRCIGAQIHTLLRLCFDDRYLSITLALC